MIFEQIDKGNLYVSEFLERYGVISIGLIYYHSLSLYVLYTRHPFINLSAQLSP